MLKVFVFLTIPVILLGALEIKQVLKKYPINGRIFGGRDADIKDYPYMLSLVMQGTHVCGAGLIADKWALTAAHCLYSLDIKDYTIRANSSLLNNGEPIQVTRLIRHQNFSYGRHDCDIALLELSTPVSCQNCKTISLGTTVPAVETNVTLTGWGFTINNTFGHTLQVIELPVIDQDVCKKINETEDDPVTKNMFCAGYFEGDSVNPCYGDAGGPAVVEGAVVGIFSWGSSCTWPRYPGFYISVPKFLDWIRENTGEDL